MKFSELRKMAYYADRYEKKRKQQYQPTYDFLLDGVPVKVYKIIFSTDIK